MRRIQLGRSLIEAGPISFGTWGLGGENVVQGRAVGLSGHDDEVAKAALRLAGEQGQIHWDTADVYGEGRSERLLGSLFGDGLSRTQITLATKVGYDDSHALHPYHPSRIRSSLEASLRRLCTDYIDILYFHHCDFGPEDLYLDDARATFEDLLQEGKIRAIGLSDWSNQSIMRVIARIQPSVVQSYRNILHDTFEGSGLRAYAHAEQLGLVFFSPLRHGLLLGREPTPRMYPPGDVRAHDPDFANPTLIQQLYRLARELEHHFGPRCPEPVLGALLAVVREELDGATILLGQRSPAHVMAAQQASALQLSPEELSWLRKRYAELKVERSPS